MPISPTFLATANMSLLPSFLLGKGCLRFIRSFIYLVALSATNLVSTLPTTVSRTLNHNSWRSLFSALSSSVNIYIDDLSTFSLFFLLTRSYSKGLINDDAHSFYILSSQSIIESYIKMNVNRPKELILTIMRENSSSFAPGSCIYLHKLFITYNKTSYFKVEVLDTYRYFLNLKTFPHQMNTSLDFWHVFLCGPFLYFFWGLELEIKDKIRWFDKLQFIYSNSNLT